jgi:hypothetical protein
MGPNGSGIITSINLINLDDGMSSNIPDNTLSNDTWFRFTEKHNKNKLNIFCAIKASTGEYRFDNNDYEHY